MTHVASRPDPEVVNKLYRKVLERDYLFAEGGVFPLVLGALRGPINTLTVLEMERLLRRIMKT